MKTATRTLTFVIAAVATISCAGGLLLPRLYRDEAFYKTAWQANDTVTLLLMPLLIFSHHLFRHGDPKPRVVWLGLMVYTFYNYAFYLFGAAFNWFFILYVSLVALSLYAIILGLFQIEAEIDKTPSVNRRGFLASFLVLTALPLGIVEVSQCINFILSGKSPEIPPLILALDLSIVVPNALLAAVLIVRKHPWGYWLGGIMFVKSFTYGTVLVTATLTITARGLRPLDPLFPFYIFISAGGLISLIALLRQRPIRQKF